MESQSTLFDESFLRRLEALTLVARQARPGQWQGERRSTKRGQSVEFADYRSYVPGDDFRLIDWNAYGRLERFFLKLFVEEEDLTVHLLIDTSLSMDWPPAETGLDTNADHATHKLNYARRAAAALGYITLSGLDRVTVSGIGGSGGSRGPHFPPHRGRHQTVALFSFLHSLQPTAPTDLTTSLKNYATQARQPGPLIIFSDFFDQPDQADQATTRPDDPPPWLNSLLPLLSRRFEISLIQLLSPDEAAPALSGDLRLLDLETGQPVEITADFEALSRYQTGLAAWQNEIRRWCAQYNIPYLPITTDTPFENLIFSFLRHQGVLR